MTQRVFVTGMGCLSGLAQGVDQTWAKLRDGHDAARAFRRTGATPNLTIDGVAVWVDQPDSTAFATRHNPRLLDQMDLTSVYAILAAHEALHDAGLLDRPDLVEKAATLIGCGAGGLVTVEQSYERLFTAGARSLHPMTIPRQMPSAPASNVSIVFAARGPCFAIASACASSAHAIAEAAEMIKSGRVEIAIVGGSEAPMTIGSYMAWQALRVLAKERCRPFSLGRDGMMLGEGAAVLILESEAHAEARGARPIAEFLGSGASSDAHHMTHPNGDGAALAIQAALDASGVSRDEPMLISAHGTGTAANDKAEAAALRKVLGAHLDASTVIATKSAHGHLCGAAGAIELVAGLQALRHGMAPPVLNYLGADPECDVPLPLGEARVISHKVLLSNSFAFGGLNSTLVARAC